MKKTLSILAAMLLLTTMLTGCIPHPLEGTWVTTINGDEGEMVLKADGTGTITSNGITRDCYWEIDTETGTLTVEQDVDGLLRTFLDHVTYKVEGSLLTITSQKGNTLVFEKQ